MSLPLLLLHVVTNLINTRGLTKQGLTVSLAATMLAADDVTRASQKENAAHWQETFSDV